MHQCRRVFISAILGIVLGVAGAMPAGTLTASVAGADPSSDIPGVPLPGPVAAGRLGGAVYDVVYRFSVNPGHVIVASLTGTTGTDFDIYLFDASATTVISNVGLQTKSTGPTSTESISWPSRLGGTYYIDLHGATDVEGDFRLTVQTLPDPTAPAVSMVLAGGKTATNQLTVPVSLSATDDLSGVTEMALSEDGTTFTEWQPLQPSTTWTFLAGDGPRVLWAKVKNGVGLESAATSDSLTIDTQPPAVVTLDPPPGSSVVGLRPRLTVAFNESIDPASWLDLGLIVQSAAGGLVNGTFAYDPASRTGSFVPLANLHPGGLYVVTVGSAKDIAGNPVTPPGSWSITPLSPTGITATAAPKVILQGRSARIDIALEGAALPATIAVESAMGPSGFLPLPQISTDDGHNSLIVAPASNTTYRFRYAGAFGVAQAQTDVRLLVRRSVVLAGRDSATVSRTRVGARVNLTAAISPAASGVSVSFRLYRFDSARRAWVYAGSNGRTTDAAGRAVLSWVPATSGSFYWRASVAPTPEFANNISPVYRWSISR
jgi:hypothetical protein